MKSARFLRAHRAMPLALVLLLCGGLPSGPAGAAATLDRVAESGRLTIGYLADQQPFSYTDAAGKPAGYGIDVCSTVGEAVKTELKQPGMSVNLIAVPFDGRFHAVDQGAIDILCGAEPTLQRRAIVDFSIPILLSGMGVVIRGDAPARLRQLLSGQDPRTQPVWRGSRGQAPERHVVAVIGGTTLEQTLIDRLRGSRIIVEVVPVVDTKAGIDLVLQRRADAFFNDRALLLDAARHNTAASQLVVLDRIYRRGKVALAVPRNDDRFRLLIDRTLSHLMQSGELAALYTRYFGVPDRGMLDMFQLVALPE
jgi:ABC-type amino acid transport substrate-binding protein